MNPTSYYDEYEKLPALAPASVSSYGSSDCLTDLDKSLRDSHPLPKVIEAQKRVSFGEVSCRSYPVILGDHPDCIGPPLSFDWNYAREEHFDLEEYETNRGPRRREGELVLDWMLRKRILRCYAACTEEQIDERTQECSRIRKQREQTKKRLSFKSSVRHVLSKVSGGLLGEKDMKHTDRKMHLQRFQQATPLPTNTGSTLVTSRC